MVKYVEAGRFIELYFDSIPDYKLRESLKICNWQFNNKKMCWQNFNNVENRQFAMTLAQDNDETEWYEGLERYYFESDNQIIVRTNSFYCNSHHDLEDVAGEVSVVDKHGEIRWFLVPMAFCETCGLYYILKQTFLDLKAKGVIRCQIMTYDQYARYGFYDDNFDAWKDIGPLKLWGYSVDTKTNLSEQQRHAILEDIVDCQAMTKDAVLSYLDFFIWLNASKHAPYVGKWEEDRKYLAQYKLGSAKRVVFSIKDENN